MKLTAFLLFISVSCFGQFTKTQLNGALHLVNYANNKNENVTDNILDITVIGGGGGVQNGATDVTDSTKWLVIY